ncbi:hypothetical protein EVJ58_g5364 [Rhodofomes roseus]|uniref:Uncharacterized protein n=1 Tax=Rhodofomes roseus TaxID=34475 RepID=A0A4Y9YGQ0_9APHY|nr:hypothetical protein EVJ58_g5364 [Rhodofomes roseus]
MANVTLDVADFTGNLGTIYTTLFGAPLLRTLLKQRPHKVLSKGDKNLEKSLDLINTSQEFMDRKLHREYHSQYRELFSKGREYASIQGIPSWAEYKRMRQFKHDTKNLYKQLFISTQTEMSDNIWAKMHASENANTTYVIHEVVDETNEAEHGAPDGVDITEQSQSQSRETRRPNERYPSTVDIPLMEVHSSTTHDASSLHDSSSVLQHQPMQTDDA